MSEPYHYPPSPPSQPGRPQGWTGTSKLPMQALGAPPPDLQPSGPYRPQGGQTGGRPGARPGGRPGGRGPGGFLRDRGKLVDYTLKGLGLLGVALVSGFLWYLIRNDPATPSATPPGQQTQSTGVYNFAPYTAPTTVTNCVAHSTERVRTYLQQHPCTSLTRSLYTATLSDGNKVITSVVIVMMDDSAAAKGLQQVSDGHGTGHIRDLVEDGTAVPGGPGSLQNAGYYSKVKGARVIVVMTEFLDKNQDSDGNLQANDSALIAVSADAAKQNLGTR